MKKKTMALVLALTMVIGCAIGGTIAYLQDSKTVTNTFTVGKVDISIAEENASKNTTTGDLEQNYKMVPDKTLAKKATVTVEANSAKCYLFVKVNPSFKEVTLKNGSTKKISDYLTYSVKTTAEDGDYKWLPLENVDNVYYMVVDKKADAQTFEILEGNVVKVNSTVTKEMMDLVTADNYPTLTFTAYACQYYKDNTTPFSATEAWAKVGN